MGCRTWAQYENYILQQWPLTRREVQVAVECIKGRKNKEIALLLGIGAETVNKTLDHVYRATGVNGRDQLVAKLLIADIENTPLQQSLKLAGEGAALVGAGFLGTLYASRRERKRPRSLSRPVSRSKRVVRRSEPEDLGLALGNGQSAARAAIDLHSSEGVDATDESREGRTEDLSWMITSHSLIDTAGAES